MRKLIVGAFVTLDGVVQAPGGPREDLEGNFKHGGWLAPFVKPKFEKIMTDWTNRGGAYLLGRKTYEIFANYWPKVTDPADQIASAFNSRPKYVASRTLKDLTWKGTTLLDGDVAAAVADLKKQDGGEIQVHGSANLIQTLMRNDLVDTFRLWFAPITLGSGKRLFDEGTIPAGFQLADIQQGTKGALLMVYERAGNVEQGEIGG